MKSINPLSLCFRRQKKRSALGSPQLAYISWFFELCVPILYWRNIAIPATRKKKRTKSGENWGWRSRYFESKTRAPICAFINTPTQYIYTSRISLSLLFRVPYITLGYLFFLKDEIAVNHSCELLLLAGNKTPHNGKLRVASLTSFGTW